MRVRPRVTSSRFTTKEIYTVIHHQIADDDYGDDWYDLVDDYGQKFYCVAASRFTVEAHQPPSPMTEQCKRQLKRLQDQAAFHYRSAIDWRLTCILERNDARSKEICNELSQTAADYHNLYATIRFGDT